MFPIRILELRSVLGTGGGPEKTILHGAAQTDPDRFAVTVCYIRDARDAVFHIDQRAEKLRIDYVEVLERQSFDWRVWRQLRTVVREKRIHIVHSHDYKTDLMALLLAQTDRVIPLSTVHGWSGNSAKERYLYYPMHKRILARFPAAIAVSPLIRSELLRMGARAERVRVVLNGIDHRAFSRDQSGQPAARAHYGVQSGETVIGAVGRLEQGKRFDILIEAFSEIRRTRAVRLLIAGEGSARMALQALAVARGVSGCVSLVGLDPDVRRFHHALDVFVQSSDSEGTPNVVLEAMAMETPIVATHVGGTPDLAKQGAHALLVAPGDIQALAGAILETMQDRAATAARVAAAVNRVRTELSFELRMRKIEAIYQELMASADRGR
jgi:glycosyltransferase involved in cell wall biosynthesis